MIDSQENYKQIDDIIDARKKLGQYDVCKPPQSVNYRYAYSSSTSTNDRFIRFDDTTMLVNEGDYLNNSELKPTESEITIVRVRRDGLTFKRRLSKWDMHDIAIPGDGSHLGESPSLVNLATLVQQNDEYLVPLSSWDPYYRNDQEDDASDDAQFDAYNRATNYLCEDLTDLGEDLGDDENKSLKIEEVSDEDEPNCSIANESQISEENVSESDFKGSNLRRPSLAGRISKFLRKHYNKKVINRQPDNDKNPTSNS